MKRSRKNVRTFKTGDYQNVDCPSFLQGMASVVDLYGLLAEADFEKALMMDDKRALYSDWEKVGDDLFEVLRQCGADFINRLEIDPQSLEKEISPEAIQQALEEALSSFVVHQH